MKSIEFCYWLQGLFELAEPTSLNKKQTQLIKEHLALVFKHDMQPMPFCSFLDGYLTVMQVTEIYELETSRIKEQLNKVFTHVIDQKPTTISAPSNREVLC